MNLNQSPNLVFMIVQTRNLNSISLIMSNEKEFDLDRIMFFVNMFIQMCTYISWCTKGPVDGWGVVRRLGDV